MKSVSFFLERFGATLYVCTHACTEGWTGQKHNAAAAAHPMGCIRN